MWNPPTKKQLQKIPKLYSSEDTPLNQKKVYMKFFLGGWTWYAMEFDGKDTFFGYVVSPLEPRGELGYFSLSKLLNTRLSTGGLPMEVDRDLYDITPYSPIKFGEIRKRIERGVE